MAVQKVLAWLGDKVQQYSPIQTSTGAPDAGKPIATNDVGVVDITLMPPGVGADAEVLVASENLSAGEFVNLWNDSGTTKVRKGDAATGKIYQGFVLTAATAGNQVTVYREGANPQLSGLSPSTEYYASATTPGGVTATPPTAAGSFIQSLGVASSATLLNFKFVTPIWN